MSAITHLIERGKEGKEERTEEAFYSLARMNTEDSSVATGQKPSGFNLKGERADLILGHKMSNRIQRKAGFLTLGTGQNKKPLALSPSLILLIRTSFSSCYSNWSLSLSGPHGDGLPLALRTRLMLKSVSLMPKTWTSVLIGLAEVRCSTLV